MLNSSAKSTQSTLTWPPLTVSINKYLKEKLDQVTEFRDQREADRKTYNAQLDLENETYAQETQIYTDTRNEYQRELAIADAGLALVNSVDFSNIKIWRVMNI